MSAAWPTVALGDVLRRSEHIIPLDPEATYKEVTVRINGKGVVERRQVQGVEIAADRRYRAKAGQFIISRIDARHGASGLIPDDLDGAVVTNDFPLFDVVKDRLDPAFLGWMSKTASFVELCKRASEGTTNRVRLSEDRFKALNILLPPVSEQCRIVARIEELATKVKEAKQFRTTSTEEVHGTINDVAMAGARPLHLAASYIIEEGFPLADLQRIAQSMGRAARDAGVAVVTGDTKVVERGKADGVFITTTGIGVAPPGLDLSGDRARPGDRVILSGSIGDHGVAVMSKRSNLGFETELLSDSAALHGLVAQMVAAAGPSLRCLRDPTRGGLAATLNELAQQSRCGFMIEEAAIPVRPEVAAPANCWASTLSTSQTRASWSRSLRRMRPIPCWRPCAPTRSAETPQSSAR
jgi:hypothetical protein